MLEQFSNLEQTFVSAERINFYCQLDQESSEGDVPEKQWPERGSIEFKELSVKYADDLPEVLHKVSFKVEVSKCFSGVVCRNFPFADIPIAWHASRPGRSNWIWQIDSGPGALPGHRSSLRVDRGGRCWRVLAILAH